MRSIDLDSLDIFRTVATEGGVIRAAKKLNRVQSNVTTRIKQLEQRLGRSLFRKQGRGVRCAAGSARAGSHNHHARPVAPGSSTAALAMP